MNNFLENHDSSVKNIFHSFIQCSITASSESGLWWIQSLGAVDALQKPHTPGSLLQGTQTDTLGQLKVINPAISLKGNPQDTVTACFKKIK